MALGSLAFSLVVYATLLLLVAVFAYEVYALVVERGESGRA